MSGKSTCIGKPGAAHLLRRGLCMLWLAVNGSPALAVPTCTVASGATLSFGNVVALASTANQTTNSGTSLWVNCSADVPSPPSLYSSSMPRTLVSGSNSLPLALSTEFPGGLELPYGSPGMPLELLLNGSAQTVVLYAKVQSIHFRGLPSGTYTATLSLTLEY